MDETTVHHRTPCNPEETHTEMGRTCRSLHTQCKLTRAQDRTGDPGTVRQQCYILHYQLINCTPSKKATAQPYVYKVLS